MTNGRGSTGSSATKPERARLSTVVGAPHPELRPLLARDYAGFSHGSEAHHLVPSATAAVPLVLRVEDPADRPPAFVLGVHGSYLTMREACAPSYVEVWLAPLGAYTVLGVPMTEIRGYTVDLDAMFGADARRVGEMVRTTGR